MQSEWPYPLSHLVFLSILVIGADLFGAPLPSPRPFTGDDPGIFPRNQVEEQIYAEAGCKKIETLPLTLPTLTEDSWSSLPQLWPKDSEDYKAFERARSLPEKDFIISRRYGISYDSKSKKLLGFVRTNGQLHPNCFLCHSTVNGIRGGSNDQLLFNEFQADVARASFRVRKFWQSNTTGLPTSRAALLLYFSSGDKFGDGPGINRAYDIYYKILKFRDLEMNLTTTPRKLWEALQSSLFDPGPRVPAKAPTWWTYPIQKTTFATGQISRDDLEYEKTTDGRMLTHFVMAGNPTMTGPQVRGMDGLFKQILSCVKNVSLPAPPKTFTAEELDAEVSDSRALRGQSVFNTSCASCHGFAQDGVVAYSEKKSINIGTDMTLFAFMTKFQIPMSQKGWDNRDFFGKEKPILLSEGYRPPPLVGLAYRPALLHNGTIGTIQDLLTPPEDRPVVWCPLIPMGATSELRNPFAMGSIRRLSPQVYQRMDREQVRRCIDTRQPGLSNQGHPFGTELTETEKSDLIYFLERQTTVAAPKSP